MDAKAIRDLPGWLQPGIIPLAASTKITFFTKPMLCYTAALGKKHLHMTVIQELLIGREGYPKV